MNNRNTWCFVGIGPLLCEEVILKLSSFSEFQNKVPWFQYQDKVSKFQYQLSFNINTR